MDFRLLRILALAGALMAALPGSMSAQQTENASAASQTDTLAAAQGLSASERLKAKVDSLRQAIEDSPIRRRQAVSRQLAAADSLRLAYDFPAAVDVLRSAAAAADSSLSRAVEEALLLGHAGLRMMGGVSHVKVSARQMFSREDFLRMFPGSGEEGQRFHATSPDGRSLYFSSKDRPGAGGYDLYVSRRDRRSGGWTDPVNMGFPYSSPYDDLLYADTGDGRHSVLVSDRGCPADSVYIYVLAYDPVPPRRAVGSARELRALAALSPEGRRPVPGRRGRSGVDMSAYTSRTAAVRAVRDSLTAANRELDKLRAALEDIPETDREAYVACILAREKGLDEMKLRLEAASKELQNLEMSFLAGEGTPGKALPHMDESGEEDLPDALLSMAVEDGKAVLELQESGTSSHILPEGDFSDYVVFPPAPSLRVRAVIPDEDMLPMLAQTVIRLHTGKAPSVSKQEKTTVYTAGPLTDRSRAGSLAMALRAMGVADVSVEED